MSRYACLHCLADGTVELRIDRKGRPYATCHSCMSRTFMHSREALRGLMLIAPQLSALVRRMAAHELARADSHAAQVWAGAGSSAAEGAR